MFGCKKEIGPQSVYEDEKGSGNLIVLNEGNFGFGNASVSLLDSKTGEITNNQYRKVNGVGIGDVLQSVNRYQDRLYFVVNNSGKVVVTDTNLRLITEITGFNSPRYIEFYGNKGFVTDLKQKAVYVIDIVTNQITNQIPTQGWTEDVILHSNNLYILDRGDYLTNSDSNYVIIVNPETELKLDSIKVGVNPNSMLIDNNRKLWVLTSGNTLTDKAACSRIDILSNNIDFTFTFPSLSDKPSRLRYNNSNGVFYFLNSSVYSVSIDTANFNPTIFFQKTSENFYGLNVVNEILYVTDAKNYNENGVINILDRNSNLINKVASSIIPQSVN